jgi:hypothetical protein
MESKLSPHLGAIIEWRRQGLSYRACCAELLKAGVITRPGNIHRWFKSQRRLAQRIARELQPFTGVAGQLQSTGAGERAAQSGTKKFTYLPDREDDITK